MAKRSASPFQSVVGSLTSSEWISLARFRLRAKSSLASSLLLSPKMQAFSGSPMVIAHPLLWLPSFLCVPVAERTCWVVRYEIVKVRG